MNPVHAQRQTRSTPQEDSTVEHQQPGISTDMLESMAFPYDLPALPYPMDALSPCISERTLRCHHGEHHRTYIEALNKAIEDTEYQAMPLRALIVATAGKPGQSAIFNNAAQAWNHAFYWDSLTPQGGGEPSPVLKQMIEASFGSVDACRNALTKAATTQFGSGWAWLAQDGKKIVVLNRRVGARVLRRLSEPAQGSCRRRGQRVAQLGICGQQPRLRPGLSHHET